MIGLTDVALDRRMTLQRSVGRRRRRWRKYPRLTWLSRRVLELLISFIDRGKGRCGSGFGGRPRRRFQRSRTPIEDVRVKERSRQSAVIRGRRRRRLQLHTHICTPRFSLIIIIIGRRRGSRRSIAIQNHDLFNHGRPHRCTVIIVVRGLPRRLRRQV